MSALRRFVVLASFAVALCVTGCSGEVKLGAVVPQSGGLASYGDKVTKGLDLALDQINAEGGFRGAPIQLIYKDDATNPDRARQVTQELIDQDGVAMVVGGVSSTVALAIAPICESNRVILLSPSASTPDLTGAGEYVFRNWPSDIIEGTAMAKFAKDLGLEKIVVFALDNEFGSGLEAVFSEHFVGKSKYRELLKSYRFEDGQTEFTTMVEEVRELAPDGVYIVAYDQGTSELIKQLRTAGVESVIMATSSVTDDVIRLAGEQVQNLVFPRPIFETESANLAVAEFVAAYREKYGEDPDIYAAHAYDALKLLVEAMTKGDSSHPDDLKSSLLGIRNYEGAAGKTDFDQNGDVVRYPRIFIIQDERITPYERFVEDGGSLVAGS